MYSSRYVIGDKLILRYDFLTPNQKLLAKGTVVTIVGVDHVDQTCTCSHKSKDEYIFREDVLRKGTNFWRDPTDRFYDRYDDI